MKRLRGLLGAPLMLFLVLSSVTALNAQELALNQEYFIKRSMENKE
jgi:hypothetical protein